MAREIAVSASDDNQKLQKREIEPCGLVTRSSRKMSRTILGFAAAFAVLTTSYASAKDAPQASFLRQKIVMKDGVQLEICVAKPSKAHPKERFPVLLTVDGYASPCGSHGRPWYADYVKAGYVVAYLNLRGTGVSEGKLADREYSQTELDDAAEAVNWLSSQPWSTGRIGMFGTSWSGFTAMLVGARKPAALKAIVTFMATEDTYSEDVRYPSGILHMDDYTVAADSMLFVTPPDQDPFDEEILRNRFDQQPMSLTFLRQQRDGEFWHRGLRRDLNPSAGDVPTMMVGAWHDPYRNAAIRALENSRGPVRAVIGPWNHSSDYPGPTADLGRVTLDWWDYFLKGKQNGVLEKPQVSVFMRRPYRPIISRSQIPGEWRSIARWNNPPIRPQIFSLTESHALAPIAGPASEHRLRMIASTGVGAGLGWIDVSPDQREGDATALVYESSPLTSELQILGSPVASLLSSVDVDHANWFVKLSDVAPDGTTTLVTGGALNGAQRQSSVEPEPLVPGTRYPLEVKLHATSWIFQPGHRMRISVSNALFPSYWPSAKPLVMTLGVGEGGSTLALPVIPPQAPEAAEKAAADMGSRNLTVAEAEAAGSGHAETTWNGPVRSQILRDDLKRTTTVTRGYQWASPDGEDVSVEFSVADDDPAKASFVGRSFMKSKWQGHDVEWRGTTELKSDAEAFHYRHVRQLLRDGKVVREREWNERVPRDFQ